jgi:hypothetical protein
MDASSDLITLMITETEHEEITLNRAGYFNATVSIVADYTGCII